MRLSSRLTVAMVALVLLATTAVGVLTYLNITASALPRALERLDRDGFYASIRQIIERGRHAVRLVRGRSAARGRDSVPRAAFEYG